MTTESFLSLALILFLIIDPIGSIPAISALIKDFDFQTQRRILFRETWISFVIAIFFQYLGETFLSIMGIENYAIRITGGVLVFMVALQMIFPPESDTAEGSTSKSKKEPFIFPIASPLLSGPGLLAIIMVESRTQDPFTLTLALIVAWIGVFAVLAVAPYLQKILKRNGLIALEQVMGMVLGMLAVEMIVKGVSNFIENAS